MLFLYYRASFDKNLGHDFKNPFLDIKMNIVVLSKTWLWKYNSLKILFFLLFWGIILKNDVIVKILETVWDQLKLKIHSVWWVSNLYGQSHHRSTDEMPIIKGHFLKVWVVKSIKPRKLSKYFPNIRMYKRGNLC